MLRAVPLLAQLDQNQLDSIAASGRERTFHSGENIVRQGERGVGLYLLMSGSADVRRSGEKISSLHPGQFFGEAALLVDQPRTADVFANTEVHCFVINRWDFWSAVGIDPKSNQSLFLETVQRLRSYQKELVE